MPDSKLEPLIPDTRKRPIRLITHTKTAALLGVVLVLLGVVIGAALPREPSLIVTILGSALGGTVLLIAFFMFLFAMRWQKAVNTMVAGDYYVYWTYEHEQWVDFVTKQHRGNRWVPWIFAGCISAVGIMVAALISGDGNHIGGSPALTWLVFAGGFTVLGAGVGLFFRFLARRRYEQLLLEDGDVFIGPRGFYLNGDYWPWSTLGQSLIAMKNEEGPPMQIVFTFRIQQKHGSTTKDVYVPVPLGREQEWLDVMEKLSED